MRRLIAALRRRWLERQIAFAQIRVGQLEEEYQDTRAYFLARLHDLCDRRRAIDPDRTAS